MNVTIASMMAVSGSARRVTSILKSRLPLGEWPLAIAGRVGPIASALAG